VAAGSVEWLAGAGTGMAHVIVNAAGQNMIMVQSGANAEVSPSVVSEHAPAARVYLAQLESPLPTIEAFFRIGRERGAINILNTAPAIPGAADLLPLADMIVLNESELATYAGSGRNRVARARKLIGDPGQTIIVTLGEEGALVVTRADEELIPARQVAVVDTTGAGDVFCGVLATGLAEVRPLPAALARANAAAALSVTRPGAGLSAPTLAELEDFLVANP
jgi:ribokinase